MPALHQFLLILHLWTILQNRGTSFFAAAIKIVTKAIITTVKTTTLVTIYAVPLINTSVYNLFVSKVDFITLKIDTRKHINAIAIRPVISIVIPSPFSPSGKYNVIFF